MIIVAGSITVNPTERAVYLEGCTDVVRRARTAEGCLDFAIGADLLDPARINVYERWSTGDALQAFRGSGPDSEQQAAILSANVEEFTVNP